MKSIKYFFKYIYFNFICSYKIYTFYIDLLNAMNLKIKLNSHFYELQDYKLKIKHFKPNTNFKILY